MSDSEDYYDYSYPTPPGYGDTFYIYAFDTDLLAAGSDVLNQHLSISDGSFLARWWTGVSALGNAAAGVQIRDRLQNNFFSEPITPYAAGSSIQDLMGTGWGIVPEVFYPENGYIGLDFYGIRPTPLKPGQIAFGGVRRRQGFHNDPFPSSYPWYEEVYSYQADFTIPAGWSASSGGFLVSIPITQFDFELRRIDGYIVGCV